MFPHSCRDLFSHLISRDRLAPNLNICHILDIANPLVGRFFAICAIFAIFAKFCQVRQSRQFRRNRHSPREHFCPPNWIARHLAKICHFRENRQNCHFLKGTHLASNWPFAWWRHFTTRTRILQRFAFMCKLRLLLLKPRWDYQIWTWKEKRKGSGLSSKMSPSCKWPIWIASAWRSFAIFAITCFPGHKLLFPLYTLEKDYMEYYIELNETLQTLFCKFPGQIIVVS